MRGDPTYKERTLLLTLPLLLLLLLLCIDGGRLRERPFNTGTRIGLPTGNQLMLNCPYIDTAMTSRVFFFSYTHTYTHSHSPSLLYFSCSTSLTLHLFICSPFHTIHSFSHSICRHSLIFPISHPFASLSPISHARSLDCSHSRGTFLQSCFTLSSYTSTITQTPLRYSQALSHLPSYLSTARRVVIFRWQQFSFAHTRQVRYVFQLLIFAVIARLRLSSVIPLTSFLSSVDIVNPKIRLSSFLRGSLRRTGRSCRDAGETVLDFSAPFQLPLISLCSENERWPSRYGRFDVVSTCQAAITEVS